MTEEDHFQGEATCQGHCLPSSEEQRSSSASEDIPSMTPKVKAKMSQTPLASAFIRSGWCIPALFALCIPNVLPARLTRSSDGLPEDHPYLGSRLVHLYAAHIVEIDSFDFCFFHGPKCLGLLVFSGFLALGRFLQFYTLVDHGLPFHFLDALANSQAVSVLHIGGFDDRRTALSYPLFRDHSFQEIVRTLAQVMAHLRRATIGSSRARPF